MAAKNKNWMLFGIDTREIVGFWMSSWAEFLWGEDSPLRRWFDDKIKLVSEEGTEIYQFGNRLDSGDSDLEAIALPESLYLERKLTLPVMSLVDLKTVLVNEVIASSPFSQEDTSWGWSRELFDEQNSVVSLVLASTSGIQDYLKLKYDISDFSQKEVWGSVEGHWVTFQGFGERFRVARYTRRLVRASTMVFCLFAFILASLGVDALFTHARLDELRSEEELVRKEASNAMVLRKRLGKTNRTIEAINELLLEYPNPRHQLVQLTTLLGDDAFLQQFQMNGTKIRLRGRAEDAAKLMQSLTDEKNYVSVSAPQAITRLGNTGMEQFYLDIEISTGESR